MTRKDDSAARSRAGAPPRARATRLIVRQLPEETLVYDLERSRAHCLGPIAASVWRHCDGRSSAARIAAVMRRETGVDVGEAGVWVAVDRLARARLLEPPLPEGGRSRREWLKQAAMVGGLTVVSITAPLSVEAATCITNCGSRLTGNCGAIPCCPPQSGGRCCGQSAGPCACRTQPNCSP